ncbi:MAG: hypothetical protein R3A78_15150 [Polyangiales bacterium]
MSTIRLPRRSPWFAALALVGACAPAGSSDFGDAPEIVPNGKADNYYSSIASEFEVSGSMRVDMTADEYADPTVREAKAVERITALGLYLTGYVTDKFEGIDENDDGEITEDEIFFHNVGYGGFYAMVRNYSYDDVAVEPSEDGEAGYEVHFTLDMAGPKNLLSMIPPSADANPKPGSLAFELQMPEGKAVDPDSVPRGDFRRFDPRDYPGPLETHVLSARVLPEPSNAYPAYADFVSDGVFDITLFYGYDYNTARSDLREAREAFDGLKDLGFKAPVTTFDALDADSGPFIKAIKAGGKSVRVEVRIFTEPMYTSNRKAQHDTALSEIAARDVFFYNGHAGPYFGFYTDEARAAQVNYWEFADYPFPTKQQLVIAQGCQTYSQYADMLYANPAKSEDNLDVITTVNYSYGIGTFEILESLVKTDRKGVHTPDDFYTIVSNLNGEWWNRQKQVFYGVMGIDGNAQLHPYANVDAIGRSCKSNTDCGDAAGNVCASFSGAKTCAAKAIAPSACPSGTTHGFLGESGTLTTGVCYGVN